MRSRGALVERGIHKNSFFVHGKDGHSYHVNKRRGNRLSLRCINSGNRLACRARANMDIDGNNFSPGRFHRHNHPKSRNLVHERRFRTYLLNECRKLECAEYSLKEIYNKVKRKMRNDMHLPREALVNVPYMKLRQSMLRARAQILPQIPHTLSELAHILEDPDYSFLTRTLDGEDSIYLGKCGQSSLGSRCVIFASRRHLRYLSTKKLDIMSDATFSSVPAAIGATQVWTIIHLRRHCAVPLVRVLMQTKSQLCYEEALRAIRAVIPDFAPETVMCDFEAAQANAWENVFPLIRVTGCFFHSSKAISAKAKKLHLIPYIRENDEIDALVRSCCALALLPFDLMWDGLRVLSSRAQYEGYWNILSRLFVYIRKEWYKASTLPMFCVFGSEDRTNNACESCNANLRAAVKNKHPNIWCFLYALIDIEDSSEDDIRVLDTGNQPNRPRSRTVLINDRTISGLQKDVQRGTITIDHFLRQASHRVEGVYNIVLDLL